MDKFVEFWSKAKVALTTIVNAAIVCFCNDQDMMTMLACIWNGLMIIADAVIQYFASKKVKIIYKKN